jgi:hypothetical protein
MALDETQRAAIRHYLGWSERFFQFDSRLEGAMNALDMRPAAEANVVSWMGLLSTLDAQIVDQRDRLKVVKLGTITLDGTRELANLRGTGQQIVGWISATLGIPIQHDVYSPGSPVSFASDHQGSSTGGNNLRFG